MDVVTLLLSSPVFSVILVLIAGALLSSIKQGAVSSIGKQGIVFNNKDNENLVELKQDVTTLKQELASLKKYNKRLELALIRLQILSTEINLETKLSLYDEYKYLGGNSYIDVYIDKLKEEL